MKLKEWYPWYNWIKQTLGLSMEEDQKSAWLLSQLIKGKALHPKILREKIQGKTVVIFGAGPSLEEDLWKILETEFYNKCVLVAADGATSALLNFGVVPQLVVTDLDGKISDLAKAQKMGSVLVIHAHGDNMDVLRKTVPKFGKVLGTTQVKPVKRVYNFGGFTDGDRSIFLSEKFGAKKIVLAGMDFGVVVGKYSKPDFKSNFKASTFKRKKLQIAKKLIEWFTTQTKTEILNLTSSGEKIRGVKNIDYSYLVKI